MWTVSDVLDQQAFLHFVSVLSASLSWVHAEQLYNTH